MEAQRRRIAEHGIGNVGSLRFPGGLFGFGVGRRKQGRRDRW